MLSKLLEIGEEGLEVFTLQKTQPIVDLLVKQRILRVDVHDPRLITQKRRKFALVFEAFSSPGCRVQT